MSKFYDIECGILPLRNRFIRLTIGETVWLVKANRVIALTVDYHRREGWYEPSELEDDPELKEPGVRELRGLVEVNSDLEQHTKESRFSRLDAQLIAGPDVRPPHDDQCWWFEEQGGSIDEVTNLPLAKQDPQHLLWFSQAYADAKGIEVSL